MGFAKVLIVAIYKILLVTSLSWKIHLIIMCFNNFILGNSTHSGTKCLFNMNNSVLVKINMRYKSIQTTFLSFTFLLNNSGFLKFQSLFKALNINWKVDFWVFSVPEQPSVVCVIIKIFITRENKEIEDIICLVSRER